VEIVHSDCSDITGQRGAVPWINGPGFREVPVYMNRRQPYREFAIHYHNANATQAPNLTTTRRWPRPWA
jgi:hypothetical protein